MKSNDVLMGVALLERTLPLLNENTRESISKNSCMSVQRNINMCLEKIILYTKDNMILMPLVEANQLISTVMEDGDFAEASDELKKILIDKMYSALHALNLFAGKWYEENTFEFSEGMSQNIIRIINSCMQQGYYFGYDKQLIAEGKI